jgi:hypothetical protein
LLNYRSGDADGSPLADLANRPCTRITLRMKILNILFAVAYLAVVGWWIHLAHGIGKSPEHGRFLTMRDSPPGSPTKHFDQGEWRRIQLVARHDYQHGRRRNFTAATPEMQSWVTEQSLAYNHAYSLLLPRREALNFYRRWKISRETTNKVFRDTLAAWLIACVLMPINIYFLRRGQSYVPLGFLAGAALLGGIVGIGRHVWHTAHLTELHQEWKEQHQEWISQYEPAARPKLLPPSQGIAADEKAAKPKAPTKFDREEHLARAPKGAVIVKFVPWEMSEGSGGKTP